jgi:hypothetical protein
MGGAKEEEMKGQKGERGHKKNEKGAKKRRCEDKEVRRQEG